MISNILTPKEIEYFDDIITQNTRKFQSSFVNNEHNERVISEFRTSRYIYCAKSQDATVRAIESRLSQIVGLPSDNVEPLQIVSYTNGQHFDIHHDAGTLFEDGTIDIVQPRRLVTIFIYLNTLPAGEGCTEFPLLNDGKGIRVQPTGGDG